MSTSDDRRENSRLEVDDPYHCKKCGAEISELLVDGPLAGDGTDLRAPELCGTCIGKLFRRASEATEYYVTIRAWGERFDDDPEDGCRQYCVQARTSKRAKEKALQKDKDSRRGVTDLHGTDGWEYLDVSGPVVPPAKTEANREESP